MKLRLGKKAIGTIFSAKMLIGFYLFLDKSEAKNTHFGYKNYLNVFFDVG